MAEGVAELTAGRRRRGRQPGAGVRSTRAERRPGRGRTRLPAEVERLTRTGRADDITTLAAHWLADPVPALHLELPSQHPSLTKPGTPSPAGSAGSAPPPTMGGAAPGHGGGVHQRHRARLPRDHPGNVELDARLGTDGYVECRVTDQGTWRPPDTADADRGHGLMVAGQVMDRMLVSHQPRRQARRGRRAGRGGSLGPGTGAAVALRPGCSARHPRRGAGGASTPTRPGRLRRGHLDHGRAAARAAVCGPGDITTADKLSAGCCRSARAAPSRSSPTCPASPSWPAPFRAMCAESTSSWTRRGRVLTLITAPGSRGTWCSTWSSWPTSPGSRKPRPPALVHMPEARHRPALSVSTSRPGSSLVQVHLVQVHLVQVRISSRYIVPPSARGAAWPQTCSR